VDDEQAAVQVVLHGASVTQDEVGLDSEFGDHVEDGAVALMRWEPVWGKTFQAHNRERMADVLFDRPCILIFSAYCFLFCSVPDFYLKIMIISKRSLGFYQCHSWVLLERRYIITIITIICYYILANVKTCNPSWTETAVVEATTRRGD